MMLMRGPIRVPVFIYVRLCVIVEVVSGRVRFILLSRDVSRSRLNFPRVIRLLVVVCVLIRLVVLLVNFRFIVIRSLCFPFLLDMVILVVALML